MDKISLRKGNLYNHLEKKIDKSLLDSNQYDLEVTINGKIEYYRIRLYNAKFVAFSVKLEKNNFVLPQFSRSCNINELNSFKKTEFYHKYFPYKYILNKKNRNNNYNETSLQEYYYHLQYITQKKEVLSNLEYFFSVPEVISSGKTGINSYDVSIECVRNNYYFILLNAKMNTSYNNNEELYMIYNKEYFINRKNKINSVLTKLCLENNLSFDIIKLLFILVGNRKKLIYDIYEEIENAKMHNDFNLLLKGNNFKVIRDIILENPVLLSEITDYINKKKDYIEYDFKKRILKK